MDFRPLCFKWIRRVLFVDVKSGVTRKWSGFSLVISMGVDVLQETLDGVGICCGVRVYFLSDVLVGCGVTLKKYRMYSWGCVWSEVVR